MNTWSRRKFLVGSAAALVGMHVAQSEETDVPATPIRTSPNKKINIAGIGVGGKGKKDLWACRYQNVVALCDVDDTLAAESYGNFPNARRFKDYRVMLDAMPEIEAVVIATPDHTHAPAALRAMRMGKHVYVQKPLAYSVEEARLMTETARTCGVATQMGNQGHCDDGVRRICEMIWTGAIGDVHEVHCWTDRPTWPQGICEPLPEEPIPPQLDWDLWLGPVAEHPYNRGYAHFLWRGWQAFGCGGLGDMGCHSMDPPYWALHLGPPASVECVTQRGVNPLSYPNQSLIRYEFSAREVEGKAFPPVTLFWHDGGLKPMHPHGVPESEILGDTGAGSLTIGKNGENGVLFIGTEGMITCNGYGQEPRLVPESRMAGYTLPEPFIPRVPGNNTYEDWFRAIKEGIPACSNFDYAGPLTEAVLLGNLALRTNKRLEWNAKTMEIINCPEMNRYLRRESYRDGFGLD